MGRPKGSKNATTLQKEMFAKVEKHIEEKDTKEFLTDAQLEAGFKIFEREAILAVEKAESMARLLEQKGIRVQSKARKMARVVDLKDTQIIATLACPHRDLNERLENIEQALLLILEDRARPSSSSVSPESAVSPPRPSTDS